MKVSKQLAKFYEMECSVFLQEVQRTAGVKLSLKEADEWEDYFNTFKDEKQFMTTINTRGRYSWLEKKSLQ
jgi:hypothetical protein